MKNHTLLQDGARNFYKIIISSGWVMEDGRSNVTLLNKIVFHYHLENIMLIMVKDGSDHIREPIFLIF